MKILGIMSGTSLDGVDIALCEISSPTSCRLLAAHTYPYPPEWRSRLASLVKASALEYALADVELGRHLGRCANLFLRERGLDRPDLIASHGHTVFHQPERGLTAQIGQGDALAAETGVSVVHGFRTLDVALGGQGAPLVPVGDRLLFGDYDACLNLGGIANISYDDAFRRVAFDVCPCNMALNALAARLGMDCDRDGLLARGGALDNALLARLDALPYYAQRPPKSLGMEWFMAHFQPLCEGGGKEAVPSLLRTVVEHIARQVARAMPPARQGGCGCAMLVTGGGAFNLFLVERMQALLPHCAVRVPNAQLVAYKEAVVFALLGYLRVTQQCNALASVTGARHDSVGGNVSGLPCFP